MRFRRVVLVGTVSTCLVAAIGAGQASAATDGSGDDPGGSSGGLLDGLTKTVHGLLGQGNQDPSGTSTPAPSRKTKQDPSGLLPTLLPKNQSGNGSSDDAGGSNDSKGGDSGNGGSKGADDASGPGGGLPLIGSLPLPKPGDNIPSHLCLPAQLSDALPSNIPACLDLTICKQGLVRDLEALPTVKLTGLAQYVQRVLKDIPECLLSLLPTTSPSASPAHSSAPPKPSPPRSSSPKPAPPAPAATPVEQEPNFTG